MYRYRLVGNPNNKCEGLTKYNFSFFYFFALNIKSIIVLVIYKNLLWFYLYMELSILLFKENMIWQYSNGV